MSKNYYSKRDYLIHPDELPMIWRRCNNWEKYRPFDFYYDYDFDEGQSVRTKRPLHLIFANTKKDEIEKFWNNFGFLTGQLNPNDSQQMNSFLSEYGENKEMFGLLKINQDEINNPIEFFLKEQENFKNLIVLFETLKKLHEKNSKEADHEGELNIAISPYIFNAHGTRQGTWKSIKKMNLDEKIFLAETFFISELNSKLKEVHPVYEPNFKKENEGILIHSQFPFNRFAWICKDLLTAFYVMFFIDLVRQTRLKRCQRCNSWFAFKKEEVQYCSTQCQLNEKQRRYRKRKKET